MQTCVCRTLNFISRQRGASPLRPPSAVPADPLIPPRADAPCGRRAPPRAAPPTSGTWAHSAFLLAPAGGPAREQRRFVRPPYVRRMVGRAAFMAPCRGLSAPPTPPLPPAPCGGGAGGTPTLLATTPAAKPCAPASPAPARGAPAEASRPSSRGGDALAAGGAQPVDSDSERSADLDGAEPLDEGKARELESDDAHAHEHEHEHADDGEAQEGADGETEAPEAPSVVPEALEAYTGAPPAQPPAWPPASWPPGGLGALPVPMATDERETEMQVEVQGSQGSASRAGSGSEATVGEAVPARSFAESALREMWEGDSTTSVGGSAAEEALRLAVELLLLEREARQRHVPQPDPLRAWLVRNCLSRR